MSHHITLREVLSKNPCYNPLLKGLNIPEEATLAEILDLEEIPLRDRLWVVTEFLDPKWQRMYMIRCARLAITKVTEEAIDPLTLDALSVAERYCEESASFDELLGARAQAWEAVREMKTPAGKAAAIMAARSCGITEKQITPKNLENDQYEILKQILLESDLS